MRIGLAELLILAALALVLLIRLPTLIRALGDVFGKRGASNRPQPPAPDERTTPGAREDSRAPWWLWIPPLVMVILAFVIAAKTKAPLFLPGSFLTRVLLGMIVVGLLLAVWRALRK